MTTEIAETFGVEDQWPVAAEPFTAWFLEDEFTSGRPPLENAGVNLVPDVRPYELMKLRLLNAGHQGIAYFGYLAGYRLVHEACQDELLSGFLLDYMNLEATPTLDPVPGVDLDQYKKTLIERFSNPQIRDTIARLCAESSDRIPKWLLPVIRNQLDTGGRSTCPPQLSLAGPATPRAQTRTEIPSPSSISCRTLWCRSPRNSRATRWPSSGTAKCSAISWTIADLSLASERPSTHCTPSEPEEPSRRCAGSDYTETSCR